MPALIILIVIIAVVIWFLLMPLFDRIGGTVDKVEQSTIKTLTEEKEVKDVQQKQNE